MRGISRVVLARDAALQVSRTPGDAHCQGQGTTWTALEKNYRLAERTQRPELLSHVQGICNGCPVALSCAVWAETERYTGLAAGMWWANGTPRPTGRHEPTPEVA